jgi:hypothetical protein
MWRETYDNSLCVSKSFEQLSQLWTVPHSDEARELFEERLPLPEFAPPDRVLGVLENFPARLRDTGDPSN